jgi:hypothetical protein
MLKRYQFWDSNWQQRSENGRRKNRSNKELAGTNHCERSGKFFGVCKLLQMIHKELQHHSGTTELAERKRKRMEMGRRTTKSV